MNLDMVANVLPFLFSIFIIVGLTRFIWTRRKTRGALPLTYAALAQLWWITGYIFELLGDNLALKLFFDDIQWIGTVALPLAFLAFVTEYLELRVKPWVWRSLISIAITVLAVVFTNRWHEWIYHSPRYLDREPFSIITYDYSPGIWFIYVFNYLIIAYCAVVMVEKALTASRLQRRQLGLFLLALVVGMVGGILSIYDVFGTVQRDLSPYYFILTDLIIIWALFRYSALDLIPIARSKIVESINDIVIVVDSQDRIVDLNASARHAFNWDRTIVIGQPFEAVVPRLDEVTNPYSNKDPDRTEIMLHIPAEGQRIYDLLVSPLFDVTEQLIGRVYVLRDITESKAIQSTLHAQARLIHAISDAVFSVDTDGIIQTWNPAAEQIYGWEADEAIGNSWKEILRPEDDIFENAKSESSWSGKTAHHHKNDSEVAVWSTVNVLLGNLYHPVGMVAVNRDRRKQELLETREMDLLRERERSFVLQEFISDVSHDVRTPLTIMQNALYLLQHGKNSEKQIEAIDRQIAQLTKIFDDMLNMSRLDKSEDFSFELHDINAIVARVIHEKQPMYRLKKQSLQFEPQVDLPAINCIGHYVPHVFTNILDNAIVYTPENGDIYIATGQNDQNIFVKFKDSGQGITDNDMPYIFDRFFRGDQARSGSTGSSGLGLSIARKIVELHQGKIEVESNPDGSTFVVYLPIQ